MRGRRPGPDDRENQRCYSDQHMSFYNFMVLTELIDILFLFLFMNFKL